LGVTRPIKSAMLAMESNSLCVAAPRTQLNLRDEP